MIFVDTGFFFALAAEDDPDHETVREVFEELDPTRLPQLCITTNHVVSETITLTRSSSGHREAVSMGRRLYREVLARIHWATPEEEKRAFDYLVQHKDKGYSAVDCLSFVIMDQYGIQEGIHNRLRLHPPIHRTPRPEAEVALRGLDAARTDDPS